MANYLDKELEDVPFKAMACVLLLRPESGDPVLDKWIADAAATQEQSKILNLMVQRYLAKGTMPMEVRRVQATINNVLNNVEPV